MTNRSRTFAVLCARLMCVAVVLAAGRADAWAQPGSNADPTNYAFRLGPFLLTPGLQINEFGVDNNVFNEAVNPKRDYVISASPDLNVFARLRFMRITFATVADFTYYAEYETERSIGRQLQGRVDFLLGRLQPYVSASLTNSFARPNREIDARAEHLSPVLQGGVSYELSATSNVFVGVGRTKLRYRNGETFEAVALDRALNHTTYSYSGGLMSAVTPLTAITLTGSFEEERFDREPTRNSTSRVGAMQVRFGSDAVVSGTFSIGFRDYKPKDPEVAPYKGAIALGGLTLPLMDRGTVLLSFQRDVQTSFDIAQSYFVNSEAALTFTHRVVGPIDFRVMGSYAIMDYGKREGLLSKVERMQSFGGGVGYNLKDDSRLGLNYEQVKRRSDSDADRAYSRNRLSGSWSYRF